jgi:hypothetical protein
MCSVLPLTNNTKNITHDYIVLNIIVKIFVKCFLEISFTMPLWGVWFIIHDIGFRIKLFSIKKRGAFLPPFALSFTR